LSTKVESSQRQIQWRRSKVAELHSQGHSQPEISRILQVSLGTVNRDLSILRQQARENIKKYIDERLPEEYEKCLVGLNAITVVDDAIRFVTQKSKERPLANSNEDGKEESNEPDYDEEEEQKEAGEITTATINQIF
jgi:CO dehydrogenase/acetyl-CoA synthase beta subunit